MVRFLSPDAHDQMPAVSAVRDLYLAAASEPPLNEPEAVADLFADLYGAALNGESVSAAVAYDGASLTAFAYGHPWRWDEQQDAWATELTKRLGPDAPNGKPGLVLYRRGDSRREP